MPAPYKRAVEQFVEHFHQEAKAIRAGLPLHRKVLYATALDALARAAFGPTLGNRERITRLIRELSGWSDADRVSLPQLQQRLRAKGRHRHRLYRKVSSDLNSWIGGAKIGLQYSPPATALMPLAQGDEAKTIAECHYSELFYAYRNSLVHEFREPGYGWDVAGTSVQPFYMSYLGMEEQWELVFPVRFFESVVTGALSGLKAHLLRHKIDPYKNFQFGSMWKSR
jgi:hypothetical protein